MSPAPAAKTAVRTACAFSGGTKITHLSRSCTVGDGSRTVSTVSPSACANASDTPGDAESALVCAVNSERPDRIRRCINAPLAVLAATVSTPRNSSGW